MSVALSFIPIGNGKLASAGKPRRYSIVPGFPQCSAVKRAVVSVDL